MGGLELVAMRNRWRGLLGIIGLYLACNSHSFAEDTPDVQESRLIASLRGVVERKGSDLIVHAKNGFVLKFNNESEECSDGYCVQHSLKSYLPELDVVIVENTHNEGADYRWISLKDGVNVTIKGLPNYSPKKSRFAVVEAADMGFSDIQIFNVGSGYPALELEYNPVRYAQYTFSAWKNEDQIDLTVMTYVNHKLVTGIPSKLIYGAPKIPGWHLEGPIEASN